MKILNAVFGLVVGIAFAVGGVFISLETAVPTFQSWQAMQSWRSTPATLINVTGSSNNTEATYRYTIAGVDYQNDRVYAASVKDNIGSYHQDMYQHLKWLKGNDQPATIWYDPDNPSQSVIDREMRWGLFILMAGFCSVFILIGLTVSYSCLRSCIQKQAKFDKPSLAKLRKQWKKEQSINDYDGSFIDFSQQRLYELKIQTELEQSNSTISSSHPWLAKKEWRNNRIRSGAKNSLKLMWGFAVFWNGISWPLVLGTKQSFPHHNKPLQPAYK